MGFFDDITSLVQPQPATNVQLTPDQQRAIDLNQTRTDLEAGGALIGGISHYEFGQQAFQAAQYQAAQLRQNAGQAQASAQHQAFDIDRQSQYIASAALASAAAGGGGASDPTVVNIIARNAGEFAYRKAVALYQGEDRARLLNMEADAKEFEGANVKSNSIMVAGDQVVSGAANLMKGLEQGSSLYQRFGAGGPKTKGAAGALP